jgi:hypothetical protein
MNKVKVFPDFLSSGLWLVKECAESPKGYRTVSMDVSEIEHFVPESILIALKYWHHVWELMCDGDFNSTMSARYKKKWNEDGKLLVEVLNFYANGIGDEPYVFEYVET